MDAQDPYRDAMATTSPLVLFRELIDNTVADLQRVAYVEEWLGPRRRLPVFDVQVLREYGAKSVNRDRLASLLASYARIASGSIWERSRGRWRRRRYSELNPLDLAELGAFSRLGDLSLFLSGVFPEHVAGHPLEPRHLARLSRLLDSNPGELARAEEPFWLWEWVGKAAYGRAGESGLARDFRTSRRLLNVLTGRYLFPIRERWFGGPPG
jgi:hypothetical protein